MNHLQDKVVVITGASSGIGAVSAKALAAHGATIVAAARGQEDLDPLVADINKAGGTAAARLTDVTDAADMQALADFTVATGWADKVTDPAAEGPPKSSTASPSARKASPTPSSTPSTSPPASPSTT